MAFLLNVREWGFGFSESLKHFVDELENLLVFEFGVEEVQVMLGFNIVEDIVSVDARLSENRIDTHFVVIKFASISYKVFKDDGGRLKVNSKSFGSKVIRNWFSNLLFRPLVTRWSFPHFYTQLFVYSKTIYFITFQNQLN